jgi:peroxiredoxin
VKEALKLVAALALVVAAAFAFVRLQENKGYALKRGAVAPTFRVPALEGNPIDLGSYRGRWVLVNFWATWCPPCVAEMPSLERLHRALGGHGLTVVSVSADEDEALLRRFVSERGVTFPVGRDPGGRTVAQAYRTTGYPETFVIDPAGLVQEVFVGPAEWDTPQALDHFRGLVTSRSTSPTK